MKHKLTVLACVGLALLLSVGSAFAQNTVTVESKNVDRCSATLQAVNVTISNTDALRAIGLPLKISGGASIASASAGPALAGFTTAVGGFPGTAGVLNAFGGPLAAGSNQHIWTLQVSTQSVSACPQGTIEIDTAFFPPAGAFLAVDANFAPVAMEFTKGVLALVNKAPICGTNADVSVNFAGSVAGKQLNASDPDVCDNLTYSLVSVAPPVTGTVGVTPEGVFSYTGACADKGDHTVTFKATDPCGAFVDCTFKLTVTNTAPVCGTNANVNTYYQTPVVDKQLAATDADGNPLTYSFVSMVPAGTNTPTVSAEGKFNWTPTCADVMTSPHVVTFRASDGCDNVECTFSVSVFQNAPVCTAPSDQTFNWNAGAQNVGLTATDDGCISAIFWSIISVTPAPANAPSINHSNFVFTPACTDVGKTFVVVVQASDGQLTCQSTFNVSVINPPPTITCPTIPFHILGDLVTGQATGSDPFGDPLTFSLISFVHDSGGVPGGPNNAPTMTSAGAFSWQTSNANDKDAGKWTATVQVADGCGQTATCTFTFRVMSFTMCLRGLTQDSANVHVLSGGIATVYVTLGNGYALGGLDLLICYDKSGLSFQSATPMNNLAAWEYFTWRMTSNGNCGTGCPSGYIRVVSIADLDNGPTMHPTDEQFHLNGQIIALNFFVSQDRNYIGQCFPVSFCTLDCGDNVLSSKGGDTLFIAIGSDPSCLNPPKPNYVARPIVFVCNAQICVDEPKDDRGDINLNGVAYEVGDAVLFTNYFIYGESVLGTGNAKLSRILASDVNNDGVPLTVADLIYLIRVITGDAQPYPAGGNPKISPYANSATTTYTLENNALSVSANSSVDLGGALYVFRYSGMGVGTPTLSAAASSLRIKSDASNGELRVLVYAWDKGAKVNAGTNEIFTIPTTGNGEIELVESQMSDASGALLSTSMAKTGLPTEYALLQNYPNPFNAGTVIRFNVVKESNWTLTVYNIAGQTVRSFSGRDAAGTISVPWNGTDNNGATVASGVYFYRVQADNFTATKKMTLLK